MLAAGPSLLWAIVGPGLLTDDFGHALTFKENGLLGGLVDRSFESTSRPLVGVYYLLTYGLLGERPVSHALVLGILNAALVVIAWRVGRRLMPTHLAFVAALVLAVAPNRASTRLWFATGNYVLATTLVLVGFWLLAVARRPPLAAVVMCTAVLLFEGTAGLLLALVGMWVLCDARSRLSLGAVVAAPAAIAALGMYLASPKRGGDGPSPGDSIETIGGGLFGSGLWGSDIAGGIGPVVFGGLIVVSLARLLPSFAHESAPLHWVRVGLVIVSLSALPFVVGGSPFAVRGIFDRTNLVPMVGVALILGAGAEALRARSAVLWAVSVTVGATLMYVANVQDVRDYDTATESGEIIYERVRSDLPLDGRRVIVVPPDPGAPGVAAFVYPTDLAAALALRSEGDVSGITQPWTAEACRSEVGAAGGAMVYDWRRRGITPASPSGCTE